jgi:hypothetical protein
LDIKHENQSCAKSYSKAVIFFSNFSINNNFSHFLHALLRLFCSLVDSQLIVWDRFSRLFIKPEEYVIWLDENLRLTEHQINWLLPLAFSNSEKFLVYLNKTPKESCISAENLIYGSGCVRLLPPEKWFGYGGCRASKVCLSGKINFSIILHVT